MLVVRLANGSRRGIPTWMFDEVDCCEIRRSATPVVSPESLLEIAKLLELSGLNIPSEGDESKLQSNGGCDVQLTTDTNKPAVRRSRKRKTDRRNQKTSVRGTDQRVDRDRRAKSPSSRRRGK